ncbi:MAG: cryptochrome/photolyase family protein, partial [Rhodovibrionaceae bacterium]|nr:cryptochrome/photolyase family protein [Rhodovibrionaceae bacterium]
RVDYVKLDDASNTGDLKSEAKRALQRHACERIVVTEPGEWRLLKDLEGWAEELGVPVEIRTDDRFFCSREDFANWAEGRKSLRMEYFYRRLRRREGILIEDGEPVGGRWNFDKDNRKALPDDLDAPKPKGVKPDRITREVLELVEARFSDHFGSLEGFDLCVTGDQAEKAFEDFVQRRLPDFGDYQDAMRAGEPTLFHGVISFYLNAGLLDPRAVCARAETAWRDGTASINAVEGFIRQILGWREFVRGLYWLKMPDYKEMNALNAKRALPAFYWTGETDMACIADVVAQTKKLAYAHHIQRLMVTGNFALLAGVAPAEVNEWYMIVYADAYEWVELPNVQGMAIFADGGIMATKPYAASGKYIDRMSDYCKGCRYDVRKRTGEGACPFNLLYWNFLAEHRKSFENNPRMAMILRTLERMDDKEIKSIRKEAKALLEEICADGEQP